MEFVDIAGLVAGASKGEGLGNKFLGNIRETDAIAQVVRCFKDDDIVHVAGKIDPLHDIEVINTELGLADLESIDKALLKVQKVAKSGDKDAKTKMAVLERLKEHLDKGEQARTLELDSDQKLLVKDLNLLTIKPLMFIANVADDGFSDNPYLDTVQQFAAKENAPVVAVCASIEAEMTELEEDELKEFLADLGLEEPGLNRVIRAGHDLLGLQTYFTAGVKEVRGWTVPVGATAPQAAGVIHTDFEKGFIRAEVIGYDDFIACGGENKVLKKPANFVLKVRITLFKMVMFCTLDLTYRAYPQGKPPDLFFSLSHSNFILTQSAIQLI